MAAIFRVQLVSMRVKAGDRRRTARRWAGLTALSVAFHAAVLGGFALRLPALRPDAEPRFMDVSLVPPPMMRPVVIATAPPQPKAVESRAVVLPTPPRYAAASRASVGDEGDVADLFGPVFADGMWPRPILVRTEPCDPDEARGADCRRELMLMGVASDAVGGAKAGP